MQHSSEDDDVESASTPAEQRKRQRQRRRQAKKKLRGRRATAAGGIARGNKHSGGGIGVGASQLHHVQVIQTQVMGKRINWSTDFHDRYFRLVRVVPKGSTAVRGDFGASFGE